MKGRRQLTGIRALMIGSQVLLLCFMAYWLRSQYYDEQEELRKDLMVHLEHSQQALSDSVIMLTIVNPALKGTTKNQVTINSRIEINDSVNVKLLDSAPAGKRLHYLPRNTSERRVFFYRNDVPGALLTNGVRLMLKTSKDLPGDFEKNLLNTDTGLLKNAFNRSIHDSGQHFTSSWIREQNISRSKRLYLTSFSTPGYQLLIGDYKGYLLKKLLPQFIITAFLLALTLLAFRVTYKSLKAQIHLADIRNDFISNMSHELKTPVATVKVALEAMGEQEVLEDLPKARDYVRMATLELNRLELLINQSLQSSLLEDGNVTMQAELVDVKGLVEELLLMMHPRFEQRNAAVQLQSSGHDFVIPADKLQVQGVVINILDNALKYAGEAPVIRMDITSLEDAVILAITDNGPGIPEQYASRIFDKFFRVPAGNEHTVKGYGLGLNYAAQVMRLHDGTISMKAAPGGGCIFTLRFKRSAK